MIEDLPIGLLHANPDQPRIETKAVDVAEGDDVHVPLVVRKDEAGYEIIDGHERWTWLLQHDRQTARCDVLEVDHQEGSFMGFRLNNARESFSEIEQGRYFAMKLKEGVSTREVARRCGIDHSTVLRCAELVGHSTPESGGRNHHTKAKGLTSNKLKIIKTLKDPEVMRKVESIVVDRKLSLDDLSVLVAKVRGGKPISKALVEIENFKESRKQERHQDRRRRQGKKAAPHRNYGLCEECGDRPYFVHVGPNKHGFFEEQRS
jgi:ParB/Sulfiredoxin domain